jgi:hypothetical protein
MAQQWPLSGMNNFGHPGLTYRIEHEGPPTLVTRFPDGTELRRRKNDTILRRIHEQWEVNRTDMGAMLQFYREKGTDVPFDRLVYDPRSGDQFTTDLGVFRFARPPAVEQVGPQWYRVEFEFVEVV